MATKSHNIEELSITEEQESEKYSEDEVSFDWKFEKCWFVKIVSKKLAENNFKNPKNGAQTAQIESKGRLGVIESERRWRWALVGSEARANAISRATNRLDLIDLSIF